MSEVWPVSRNDRRGETLPILLGLLQPLHVYKVLLAPRGTLVDQQMLSGKHGCILISEASRHALSPRFRKLDTVDGRDDVDPDRFHTDLEDQPWPSEIGDRQVMQGSAKISKRGQNAFGVVSVRSNPYVKVLGRANEAVRCQRVSPDDDELNATIVECG